MEFQPWPKIARLSRDCVITEKLDGTNAQIYIEEVDAETWRAPEDMDAATQRFDNGKALVMRVGSRTRWLSRKSDNYGFAAWAFAHADELLKLGPGRHFGEWWGAGIQRRYDLTEKRFSLFNTHIWSDPATRPACCSVVPVLYSGLFTTEVVDAQIEGLKFYGSTAAPGFMRPEGVIVYHVAAGVMFKKLIENDELPKGSA